LDEETPYRLYEPGERNAALAGFAEEIQRFLAVPSGTILVAEEEDGRLVGYLQAIGRPQARLRHVVSINVGILQSHTGRGLGAELFTFLEEWARTAGVHRLDLSVMTTNPRALKLYQKLGFAREGVKRRSMLVGGEYVDEILMAKWLG
ncbi:GNAT family N-acetyltransferase, partial [Ruminococcaceae bacterium OttesenSCG-928-O06]|nr:GNAT family N-acetyltransferase [Ruminococcaceae bacterium OttesenSCG-928-O06]